MTGVLCFLAFFVFLLTKLRLQRVIRMLFYLAFDYLLLASSASVSRNNRRIQTDACRPAFFNVSISIEVRGWTTFPSFMYSFVASVSSRSGKSLR